LLVSINHLAEKATNEWQATQSIATQASTSVALLLLPMLSQYMKIQSGGMSEENVTTYVANEGSNDW
jgi:hypothetical protein